ncbi:hypothetical protein V5O48_007258 [Marasmius crinis-equi]|uniref:Rho-GAP domain-containing protein n=1 Tax=Marasmius crinis-equi TaxID=585013 RepID=A0ABR3FHD3_9AGAR
MSSDNALPLPVPRHARLQDLQAALTAPRPHSSSLVQAMGQSSSKPSTTHRGIASLASTGFKLKRAFAGRRKRSEDATTSFSTTSSQSDRELDSSRGSPTGSPSQPARVGVAVPPSEVTAPSSPTISQQTKLTLKLVTQVLPGVSRKPAPKASPPPPPPPAKPASMLTVPDATTSRNVDNRGSIIPISPGISSAVNFMQRIGEEEKEKERLAAVVTPPKETEKATGDNKTADVGMESRDKGKQAEVEPERKQERSKERPANDESDEKLKQGWRKSDSTMSHHTIRPGAQVGNRSSRPVSMAESLQSNHTIVPVTKRLSALLTDAEFQMPEEDDSSFKSASEELASSTPPAVVVPHDPPSSTPPSSSAQKTKNRRSMSLNLGSLTQKTHLPAPPTTSMSVGSLTELQHQASKPLPGPPITSTSTRETPTLTRAAANGIISPSSTGVQTTGNNIRGRLAAWSTTSRSSDGHSSPSTPTSRPAHTQHLPPSSFPRKTPSPQPTGLRQTAISITGGFAPAAGLAKRAVEKMGRAWGGFSSNSSNHSGYSSSSSSTGRSSSENNLRRTNSNNGASMASLSSKGKRRTPDAPSGSWSISSSTHSNSDSEGFIGPSLGTRIRGPMRGLTVGHGGVVFGRRLDVVVRETAVGVGLPGHEGIKGHARTASVDKNNLDALEHRLLPALVVRCAQHLLVWGLHEEGLFRVNGRPSHVSKLRQEFDAGADFDMRECSPGELDPHAVASVFKAFLRELPEPILTHSLIPYFEAALSQENAANAEAQAASPQRTGPRGPTLPSGPKAGFTGLRKPPSLSTLAMPNFSGMRPPSHNLRRALQSLLNKLPSENKDLIRTVTELIKATAKEHRETKMPLSNLLLVFCPSLNMNPPLLRVLCEAEGIWDGSPIESPVLDIKRETVVLDIKPESSSADASTEDEDGDDNETYSDAHDAPVEETSSVASSVSSSHAPSLQRAGSKREGPRSRPMGPRRAGAPVANDGFTSSPAASSISIATSSEDRSIPSPSDRGFVFSPPPLSSSQESLPTASSSSAAPSLADLQLNSETYGDKKVDLGTVEIADDLEHDLLNPRRFMVNPGPVEFPRTSGSTPTTPVSASRRSILPLSLNGGSRSDSGTNSVPPSPGKRLKKPSLHLLFNKRSASSLTSSPPSAPPNGSSPAPYTSRTASDSSISTPQTARTTQSTTLDLPPSLDTPIESTPLRFGMGFETSPTIPHSLADKQSTPPKVECVEDPIPRISAPTPPPGETPIAKLYSASSSTLSLSLDAEAQQSESNIHLYSSHLRPKPTRQQVMAKQSTTSLNHLMMYDDEEQEDWTQSVLIAAGAER